MKSGYCTIMWNGRDNRASKMNHHQPHQRVVFSQESDVCMVELERSPLLWALYCCCSVAKSCLTLRSHGLQYAKLPCPSPSPRVCPSSCPLHQWCHPTISPSVTLFSFCLQSFPATRSFPMSQLFASGGQSTGASAPVLPMSIQGWFPLRLTDLISLLSKGLSGVFFSATVWKHQFFDFLPSFWSSSHICTWLLERYQPWLYGHCQQSDVFAF